MAFRDFFTNLTKDFRNVDPNRPEPEKRKGIWNFVNNLINKKQSKTFVLNAETLGRLAKSDPVIFAIHRTIKSRVNSTGWDIVPDTEKIDNELDRWEDHVLAAINPYGFHDNSFETTILGEEVFNEISEKLDKILADTLTPDAQKTKAVRWIFKSAKRKIVQLAQQHCETIKSIFERPNNSAETSLRALQELVVDDLLVYDAGIVIKNYSRAGKLAELYTVPGQEIKIYRNEDRTTPQPPEPAYVWENDGIKRAEFTNEELIYIMQNPTQDGYGMSPLEVSAYIITASLFAEQYNIDFFKNSNVPPGLLNLGKDITEEQRGNFQRLWDNEIQGKAGGLHRLLFVSGTEKLEFVPIQTMSHKDMQMMEYLRWALNIKCACYGVSPQDIGFIDNMRGLGSGGVAEVQQELTQSRGIAAVLQLLEQYYNAEIVKSEFAFTDVKFKWILDDSVNPQIESTVDIADIQAGVLSRNDRREKLKLKPIDGGEIYTITTGAGLVPVEDLSKQTDQTLQEELTTPEQGLPPGEEEELLSGQQPIPSETEQEEPAPEEFTQSKKTGKLKKLKVTVNKNKTVTEQKELLDKTVQKLRDVGIEAELRIGFETPPTINKSKKKKS